MTKFVKGDRVSTKFGDGVLSDDYWKDRNRFTVTLDDGGLIDVCHESLRTPGPPPLSKLMHVER